MKTSAQLAWLALQHFILAMLYGFIFCLVIYCFIG